MLHNLYSTLFIARNIKGPLYKFLRHTSVSHRTYSCIFIIIFLQILVYTVF